MQTWGINHVKHEWGLARGDALNEIGWRKGAGEFHAIRNRWHVPATREAETIGTSAIPARLAGAVPNLALSVATI